jgi:hypothetical protein
MLTNLLYSHCHRYKAALRLTQTQLSRPTTTPCRSPKPTRRKTTRLFQPHSDLCQSRRLTRQCGQDNKSVYSRNSTWYAAAMMKKATSARMYTIAFTRMRRSTVRLSGSGYLTTAGRYHTVVCLTWSSHLRLCLVLSTR